MPDLVGQMLEHYRIVEKIGEGGMGAVYRARDERLDRDVAIKLLPPEVADDPGRRARFEREARAAAALQHPNILAIHELGLHEKAPFIVTELLEGESLRSALAAGPLESRRALELAVGTAIGLAAAHERGIVHRDLKPENLFVTRDGTIRILDFGLAKLIRPEPTSVVAAEAATETLGTAVGTVLGTIGYMSPEQVRGGVVDARSDIFSLGVVLYEMLTGANPFRRATTADSASAVLTEHPPAVSTAVRDARGELDRIVQRCLAKHPEDRFQSARDLGAALQEALGGAPRLRPGVAIRGSKLAAIIAAAVVALLLGTAGWHLIRSVASDAGDRGALQPRPPRIVVLPFDNLGQDADEFFAAGIGDELSSRLAAVSGVRAVIPPRGRQPVADVLGLGREVGADFVLTGTVRWSSSVGGMPEVRITPKLIRVSDGHMLWAQTFDRTLEDIFAIQSDIAGRVLGELDITLVSGERDAIDVVPTSNMEAYKAFLRGRYYAESVVEEDVLLSASMFEQAVTLDPDFALAWAELSMAYSRLTILRIDDSDERRARTAAAAERALALEPELARGHLARAVYLAHGGRDRAAALAELAIARRQRPADRDVLEWHARLLAGEGRFHEAIEALERAIEVNPTDYPARCLLGSYLNYVRRHAEADAQYRRAVALQPDRLDAYLGRLWNALAWEGDTELAREVLATMPLPGHRDALELEIFLLFAERRFDRALELIHRMPTRGVESAYWRWPRELLECHAYHWLDREADARDACAAALADAQAALESRPHDPRLWTTIAYSQALLGRPAEAVEAAERACAVASPAAMEQEQFRRDLAAVAAITGDADRAIPELREALARPGWLTRAWLAVDWRYDRIRDDPRFRELAAADDGGRETNSASPIGGGKP